MASFNGRRVGDVEIRFVDEDWTDTEEYIVTEKDIEDEKDKLLYSTISIEPGHYIEITFFSDYVIGRGKVKEWVVKNMCMIPRPNVHGDAGFTEMIRQKSLARAKITAIEMTKRKCWKCYDDNGIKRKIPH